ncbi:MAG: hypothetical protein A3F43_06160 [Gammaproteobacteria bacterium RIFCSPHIGHO2_12_FULL_42_10]|nr:MAG: hypothetical protein A3F43_06160 [Gammaproteobacteria bacterium RIFCSPHIGHO2_12_FULL_42_10]
MLIIAQGRCCVNHCTNRARARVLLYSSSPTQQQAASEKTYQETLATNDPGKRYAILSAYVNDSNNHNEKFYQTLIQTFGKDNFIVAQSNPRPHAS